MRKPINVTLNKSSLALLRQACYGRLEYNNEQLGQALLSNPPQSGRDAWAAFTQLEFTGSLLNRIGWTDCDDRDHVKLTSHPEVTLAISILRDEAGVESAIRAAALEDNETDEADHATRREMAIHTILSSLEVDLAAATVSRAATFAAHPVS